MSTPSTDERRAAAAANGRTIDERDTAVGGVDIDFGEVIYAPSVLAPGAVIAERYRVIRPIGAGGMGAVYLGEHVTVGRDVAIKVLHARYSENAEVAGRFAAEARTASAIGHPGIIDVLDAGRLPDGGLYLVMEYVDGQDLGHELDARGTLPPLEACRLILAVAEAIAAAHEAGVVHRDLKPDNVIVIDRDGEDVVKILDFGVAAHLASTIARGAATTPGTVIGTPVHMSPEQAVGEPASPAFDVYSLASMLFHMVSGRPPFVVDNPMRLLARKQIEEPPLLREVVEEQPPAALEAFLREALAVDIDRRPRTADEFITRLERVIEALERPVAVEVTPVRGRARAALPGLLVGIVAVVTGVVVLASPGDEAAGESSAPIEARAAAPAMPAEIEVAPPASELPSVDHAEEAAPASEGAAAPGSPPEPLAGSPVADTPAPERNAGPKRQVRSKAHESPRCARVREQTRVAREAERWETVLQLASDRACWERARDAQKLEVQARMEIKDFTGCVAATRGLRDAESQRWRELCRKRAGL